MNRLTLSGVRIGAVSLCVPKGVAANEAKVAAATGVRTRRIAAPGATALDLSLAAAEAAFAETGVRREDFGAVLFVSFTQPDRMPAAACAAQARLGLPKDVVALDVSLACSGWGYGLYLAGLLARETGRRTLLLDGDVQSPCARAAGVSPLLADAGTATVVERAAADGARADDWRFAFLSDGEKGGALKLADGGQVEMDGFAVFQFVATEVVARVREFASAAGLPEGTTFVPHQPNAYLVRQLARSAGIPEGRTALSCDELGNLASASIPATIAWRGIRGPVLFAGFGGGLSVALGAVGIGEDCALCVTEA